MNYKMTVKAKVSSGFANLATQKAGEIGRERREKNETEIAAASQPIDQPAN